MSDRGPLTPAEAAEALGKSRRTIDRMLADGRLYGTRTAEGWRIPRGAIVGHQLGERFGPKADTPETPEADAVTDTAEADTVAELTAELAEWRKRAKVAARRARRRAAELAEWQRRAEVAEAVAAERAAALNDARASLALAQRLAALTIAENVTPNAAITVTADETPTRATPRRRWIPRRWK